MPGRTRHGGVVYYRDGLQRAGSPVVVCAITVELGLVAVTVTIPGRTAPRTWTFPAATFTLRELIEASERWLSSLE